YKYDRSFALKSTELYKNELIISPKNAQDIVKTKTSIDERILNLATKYKKNNIYNIIRKYKDSLVGTKLERISLKSFRTGNEKEIYDVLKNASNKNDLNEEIDVLMLIDLIVKDTAFIEMSTELNQEIINV